MIRSKAERTLIVFFVSYSSCTVGLGSGLLAADISRFYLPVGMCFAVAWFFFLFVLVAIFLGPYDEARDG